MTPAVVLDLGVGNIGNLARAVRRVGGEPVVTADPATVRAASCLVLAGVGAFRAARERLRGPLEGALRGAVADGAWLLGICVGYQLLFDAGEEFGVCDGLGLLTGVVRELPGDVPLPHIGWNRLAVRAGTTSPASAALPALADGGWMYFVHSFAPDGVPAEQVLATTTHGRTFASAAGSGRVAGTQFHPERSGDAGLVLLQSWLAAAGALAAVPERSVAP